MDEYHSGYQSAHIAKTALNSVMTNLMCDVHENNFAILVLLYLSAALPILTTVFLSIVWSGTVAWVAHF